MASPRRNGLKAFKEFAGEYLLPAAAVMVAGIILLGLLAITGLFVAVLIPILATVAVLIILVLLSAEMLWRVAVLDLLLGAGASIYAITQLTQNPVLTFIGALLGALTAALLYLSGEMDRVRQMPPQNLTDASGQSHAVLILCDDRPNTSALSGMVGGLVTLLLCWVLRDYGLWGLFWGAYASLAVGRALSWFSVEADLQQKIFWQPFAFLHHYPPFDRVFRWWQQTRHWLGIGLAHWSPRGRE